MREVFGATFEHLLPQTETHRAFAGPGCVVGTLVPTLGARRAAVGIRVGGALVGLVTGFAARAAYCSLCRALLRKVPVVLTFRAPLGLGDETLDLDKFAVELHVTVENAVCGFGRRDTEDSMCHTLLAIAALFALDPSRVRDRVCRQLVVGLELAQECRVGDLGPDRDAAGDDGEVPRLEQRARRKCASEGRRVAEEPGNGFGAREVKDNTAMCNPLHCDDDERLVGQERGVLG